MKRTLLFAVPALCAGACLLLLLCRPAYAAADTREYARVTDAATWLYEQPDEQTGLFILPETYFVRVTGATGDYYAVSYLSDTQGREEVRGYCLQSDVSPVDFIPETPFLVCDVEVTYRAGEGLPEGFLSKYVVTAAYYGTYPYGSADCYCVRLDGRLGYVPASACSAPDYVPNTEHTETEVPETAQPAGEGGAGAAGIVLACALAVVALGGLYFLFRPVKARKPAAEDAEEFFEA